MAKKTTVKKTEKVIEEEGGGTPRRITSARKKAGAAAPPRTSVRVTIPAALTAALEGINNNATETNALLKGIVDASTETKAAVEKIAAAQQEAQQKEQEERTAQKREAAQREATPRKVEVVNQKSVMWEALTVAGIIIIIVIMTLFAKNQLAITTSKNPVVQTTPVVTATKNPAPVVVPMPEDSFLAKIEPLFNNRFDNVQDDIAEVKSGVGLLRSEMIALGNIVIETKSSAEPHQSPVAAVATPDPAATKEYVNILLVGEDGTVLDSYKKVQLSKLEKTGRSVTFPYNDYNERTVVLTGNTAASLKYTEQNRLSKGTLIVHNKVHDVARSTVYTDNKGTMFVEMYEDAYQPVPAGSSYNIAERTILAQ